ncbi:protein-disulfide reductase DsbD [Pseudothauera nasutitermitis]|uniref:Thiol:disulfide interchange protein DsbD n=1 Tax=Pseudothauera nasutitermitis TaxID=2565930 RepID=A0A4S4AVK6_9RHOO|nr:protein-disulfide reductase DsbD [Pseudothauera nasutitermitis]THF64057.1 protein-disulfide reductase DsbD [Pseudothauera nasutitermitis]
MFRLPFLAALVALLTAFAPGAHAQGSPIEPEKAFAMSAHALDPHTVQVDFRVHKDYYLYGDKFRFVTDPPEVRLGEPVRAQGEMKNDEFFGLVETLRGPVSILLPVESVPDGLTAFRLTVSSQGCWDGGICYPPTPQSTQIDLANPGGGGGKNLLQRALGGISAQGSPAPAAASADGGDESGRIAGLLSGASLPLVLASFFGFGLLLAFTPCHFPMIPILSGIIVGQGTDISRMRALGLSLAYVLGMAVTYAAAGVAAGLSGTLLSAALQNVWVLGAFALVFVLLALSMFGFYELQLPTALQSRLADRATHRKGGSVGGVVVMGALSALIVGPCVAAPLAGALLYIAQTGDALLGGLALFVMALGTGVPLLAVGVAARSALPKAGPWMEGVKKAFGVMLLAVAIWLLTPVVPALFTMLAWAALLLISAIFLHALDPLPPNAHGWQRFWKGFGVILLLAGAALLAGALAGSRDPLQPLAVLRAEAATRTAAPVFERVDSVAELDARLAASDRPVMLDFYADWCVSCKEMERYTFTDPAVAARMERMLLLKADVTANTDEHKALLRRFSLFGPPGTIFFDAAGQERDGLRVVGFMKAGPFGEILDRALR